MTFRFRLKRQAFSEFVLLPFLLLLLQLPQRVDDLAILVIVLLVAYLAQTNVVVAQRVLSKRFRVVVMQMLKDVIVRLRTYDDLTGVRKAVHFDFGLLYVLIDS